MHTVCMELRCIPLLICYHVYKQNNQTPVVGGAYVDHGRQPDTCCWILKWENWQQIKSGMHWNSMHTVCIQFFLTRHSDMQLACSGQAVYLTNGCFSII
jgi:hypothetical protein